MYSILNVVIGIFILHHYNIQRCRPKLVTFFAKSKIKLIVRTHKTIVQIYVGFVNNMFLSNYLLLLCHVRVS